MSGSRKNLCKVSPELKQRLDDQRDGQSWPDFMDDVATLLETGVLVKTERYGQGVNPSGDAVVVVPQYVDKAVETDKREL